MKGKKAGDGKGHPAHPEARRTSQGNLRCTAGLGVPAPRFVQNWSAEMISPPPALKSHSQTEGLIEFLMKWTDPSQNDALTPPGWALREPM